MRKELIETVHNIGVCLSCGASKYQTKLDKDHFFPRSMLTQPNLPEIDVQHHPLRKVVMNRANLFVFCRSDHEEFEIKKQTAFGGPEYRKVDPEGLLNFLREEYPITQDPKHFIPQLNCMIQTTERFVTVATHLNGELPGDLKKRYQVAAYDALSFVDDLKRMKEEGLLAESSELILVPDGFTIVNITHL